MLKIRELPESNYRGLWFNGKTIRVALDKSKPITELRYPEFFDVKITDKCGGMCKYCYMDSTLSGKHAEFPVQKLYTFFGNMTPNQRPFQVALGGGEPTLHPEFIKILIVLRQLGIEPNYTTNGQFVGKNNQEEILNATKLFCGGVAVSCHPHLRVYWQRAAALFCQNAVRLNLHIIISDRDSIALFMDIYDKWKYAVEYFVLLPYVEQGRARKKDVDWDYLVSQLPKDKSKIAFGAGFYEKLQYSNIDVSLYEPEIMSKYLDLTNMEVHPSSFQTN